MLCNLFDCDCVGLQRVCVSYVFIALNCLGLHNPYTPPTHTHTYTLRSIVEILCICHAFEIFSVGWIAAYFSSLALALSFSLSHSLSSNDKAFNCTYTWCSWVCVCACLTAFVDGSHSHSHSPTRLSAQLCVCFSVYWLVLFSELQQFIDQYFSPGVAVIS